MVSPISSKGYWNDMVSGGANDGGNMYGDESSEVSSDTDSDSSIPAVATRGKYVARMESVEL